LGLGGALNRTGATNLRGDRASVPKGRIRLSLRQWSIVNSYLFIAPFYVLFVVFVVVPFFWGIGLSFAHGGILQAPQWVGLDNYRRLLLDFRVRIVLLNAIRYVVLIVPSGLFLGIIFALLIHHQWTKWPGVFRAIVFFPILASGAAVGQIWGYILLPRLGIMSYILHILGLPDVKWLTDPAAAPFAVVLLTVWQGVGFQTLVLGAALTGLPQELLDAARMDGAGSFSLFTRIILPLLQPVMLFLVVIGTIGAFQIFDTVYVLTGGGPEYSTQTIVGLIYAFAFGSYNSEGLAAALGVILFLVIVPVSLFQMRFLRSHVEY
jgi:ABC-type sugar transport system permease subunit